MQYRCLVLQASIAVPLAASLAVALALAPRCAGADPAEDQALIPVTDGTPCSDLQPFDDEMLAFMRARSVPGGALAVSRNGKIVLSRGYGWADKEAGEKVAPEALFRIASMTKPVTSLARLMHEPPTMSQAMDDFQEEFLRSLQEWRATADNAPGAV